MPRVLALHVAACQPVKFVKDDGCQPFEGTLIPFAPGVQQLGYLTYRRSIRLCLVCHCDWRNYSAARTSKTPFLDDSFRPHSAPPQTAIPAISELAANEKLKRVSEGPWKIRFNDSGPAAVAETPVLKQRVAHRCKTHGLERIRRSCGAGRLAGTTCRLPC
jgi:hypothetical protein